MSAAQRPTGEATPAVKGKVKRDATSIAEAAAMNRDYVATGFALCPIPLGEKGPRSKGWNLSENAITSPERAPELAHGNVGLLHRWSKPQTCTIDIDAMDKALPWFAAHGIDLQSLLDAPDAVQIVSGKPNRAKSLYRLPEGVNYLPTDQRNADGFELRCATDDGTASAQDVLPPSIHPDTGKPYKWGGKGNYRNLPVLPGSVLTLWKTAAKGGDTTRQSAALQPDGKVSEGGRNNYLASLAGTMRRRGMSPEAIEAALRAENETRCNPPLPDGEARGVARSVSRYEPAAGADGAVATVDAEGRPRPQSSVLIDLGRRHHLFHDAGGDAYARVPVGNRQAIYPIGRGGYAKYLGHEFYQLAGKGANRNAIGDAVDTLAATAECDGGCEPVYLRVGKTDDAIVVDVGDETGDAFIVTAAGWTVAPAPVNFRRSGKPLPLPRPPAGIDAAGGDFSRLWCYIHVQPEDRPLVAGWLLMALNPSGPYPIALVAGEAGAGKTSVCRVLKLLTDPSDILLRPQPSDDRALLVAALSSWSVLFDNLSSFNPQISDCLCRVATGGGYAARKLYTDAEEILVDVTRPLILNGITDVATRADLTDRCLHLLLPRVPTVVPETELKPKYERDAPFIFAALLDGLALALRDHETVEIGRLPRMADFAKWAAAGVPALGFTSDQFASAYANNRQRSAELTVESSPVAAAVLVFMADKDKWTGTAAALLTQLQTAAGDSLYSTNWPKSVKGLVGTLRRLAPPLRQVGVHIEQKRTSTENQIVLCKVGKQVPQAPLPPVQEQVVSGTSGACGTLKPTLHTTTAPQATFAGQALGEPFDLQTAVASLPNNRQALQLLVDELEECGHGRLARDALDYAGCAATDIETMTDEQLALAVEALRDSAGLPYQPASPTASPTATTLAGART